MRRIGTLWPLIVKIFSFMFTRKLTITILLLNYLGLKWLFNTAADENFFSLFFSRHLVSHTFYSEWRHTTDTSLFILSRHFVSHVSYSEWRHTTATPLIILSHHFVSHVSYSEWRHTTDTSLVILSRHFVAHVFYSEYRYVEQVAPCHSKPPSCFTCGLC